MHFWSVAVPPILKVLLSLAYTPSPSDIAISIAALSSTLNFISPLIFGISPFCPAHLGRAPSRSVPSGAASTLSV